MKKNSTTSLLFTASLITIGLVLTIMLTSVIMEPTPQLQQAFAQGTPRQNTTKAIQDNRGTTIIMPNSQQRKMQNMTGTMNTAMSPTMPMTSTADMTNMMNNMMNMMSMMMSPMPMTSTPAMASNTGIGLASAQQETKASIVSGASTMGDKAFSPNPINVKVGDTVTWTNDDTTTHTVTSGSGPSDPNKGKDFDSSPNFNPLLAPKQTFQHKFTTAGEFSYFCQLHPTMVGKVVVS